MMKVVCKVCLWCFLMVGVSHLIYAVGDTDRARLNLKGAVKYVASESCFALISNGKIIKGEIAVNLPSQNILEFDEDGMLIQGPDSVPGAAALAEKDSIVKVLDGRGYCIKQLSYHPDGALKQSQRNVFDDLGRIRLSIVRQVDSGIVDSYSYSYDHDGNLLIKVVSRHSGAVWQERYRYDETGNWVLCVEFFNNTPMFYTQRTIEYY